MPSAPILLDPFVVTASNLSGPTCFPSDLRDDKNYPFVKFSTIDKPQKPVFLPIPPGLTFSDSQSYSTINLGILKPVANTVADIARGVADQFNGVEIGNADAVTNALKGSVGALTNSIKQRVSSMNAAAAASILARAPAGLPIVGGISGEVADLIDYGFKQVISPNTSTTFQSSNIRSFAFGVKMVPREQKDAKLIRKIVNFFRENSYPEGNDIILKYPSRWSIKFYNGTDQENTYLPKIHECYLTSVTTSYNGSTNLFHEDGSPVEVDLALTFQETRQLTRQDIEQLDGTTQ